MEKICTAVTLSPIQFGGRIGNVPPGCSVEIVDIVLCKNCISGIECVTFFETPDGEIFKTGLDIGFVLKNEERFIHLLKNAIRKDPREARRMLKTRMIGKRLGL